MIYTVGNRKFNLPEIGTKRKIRTPRQIVPFRDMAETCRTIDALLPKIQVPKNRPIKIVDGVARSGFWAAVFLNRWPDCNLLLNECNQCYDVLKNNFPECQIESNDIHSWTPPKSDILLLDFDDFTLKTFKEMTQHKEILKRIAPTTNWLLIADNTCFGFKFGNLRHYGVDTEEQYYQLLDYEVRTVLDGKRIIALSAFLNAAMVLYAKDNGKKKIEHIQPSKLFVARGGKQYKRKNESGSGGFGLCG